MNHRLKVLSTLSGNIHAKVLFIAEAPGRLGADQTGIPLYGDRTGDNFEKLLDYANLSREDIFITNAILCNPRQENGNNGTPKREEIFNCSYYLRMTIELIQPQYIVSLGRVALESLNSITPHAISLRTDVGKVHTWGDYKLIPFYHPGPRALIHRPFDLQKKDYAILANLIEGKNKTKSTINHQSSYSKFEKVILNILAELREITFFKLTKLLYLYDYNSIMNNGHSITNEVYLREANGPWMPNLRVVIKNMDESLVETRFIQKVPLVKLKLTDTTGLDLSQEEKSLLSQIIEKYGYLSDSELKTKVYLTKPMRYVLKEEKHGKRMKNQAVIYKSKTILDKIDESEIADFFSKK